MYSTEKAVAAVIERVLEDRQRHEERVQIRPGSNRQSYCTFSQTPKLRVYVATAHGCYAFKDDRDQVSGLPQDRIEVVEAEFLARTPEAFAKLPTTGNTRVSCPSECKGEMLFRLAQDNKTRPAVDYVAFLDDDIEVCASALLRGATAAAQRNSPLFQLQLSQDSHAVWPQLKERQGQHGPIGEGFTGVWADLDFVEIMAPIVAQAELDRGLLDLLEPFKSGFGWDFYLVPVLAELYEDFRPGLFTGACMRHLRSVMTNSESLFSNGLTAMKEEELLRAGLLRCLLRDGPLPDRKTFLRRLHHELMTNDPKLLAIAAGLCSSTERQWHARILENKLNQLHLGLEHQQLEMKQAHDHHELEMKQAQDCYEHEMNGYSQYVAEIKRSHTWRVGRLILSLFVWPIRLFQALRSRVGSF